MKGTAKICIFLLAAAALAASFFLIGPAGAATNVSSCQDLNIANEVYTLTANVSSGGSCFNVSANGITIDGSGFWINYSQTSAGYAVNNSEGYDNITIKNLNIVQGSTSSSSYAIYGKNMENGTIFNNSITTSGTLSYGIFLWSSNSSTVSNNNISSSSTSVYLFLSNLSTISYNNIWSSSTYGLYLRSSGENNITRGSAIGSFDYYIRDAGAANNFTDTNFTAMRRIYFYDTSSWFNYNNQTTGSIWFKTNVSAQSSINRTLVTWSQTSMKWNDTNSTAGITANYNLTGLLANTQYNVYNTSKNGQSNPYSLTTDANRALSFNILLIDNTEMTVNTSAGDSVPPAFSLNSANSTRAGSPVNFSVKITDETALSGYIFETNNTGTWVNTTWTALASGGTAFNITTLNSSGGVVVNYSFYANDSSNNWAVGRWSITLSSLPRWSANSTSLPSPQAYNPSNSYGFQINWTDGEGDFANATFQLGKPNGLYTNYTKCGSGICTNNNSAAGPKVWYINFTQDQLGGVGTYNFTWFGTDTSGLQNKTDTVNYAVSAAPTLTRLFLNGTEGNRNYNTLRSANFTATLNISGKTVNINTNISGWTIASGTAPLYNYTVLQNEGIFNITGWFAGDENYSASSATYFASVTSSAIANITLNFALHLGSLFADDSLQNGNNYNCVQDGSGWLGLTSENPANAQSGNMSSDYNINVSFASDSKAFIALGKGSCANFRRYAADAQLKRFLSPLIAFSHAKTNLIQLILQFNRTDIINDAHWGKGIYMLSIRDEGYDSSSGNDILRAKIVK